MTENTENVSNKRNRKRGIRVSRSKLEAAKLAAGFDTQYSLAVAIAQFENLASEKTPINMVRKVFSGRPVDPKTIERIARVLNVQAFTLYLNKEEALLNESEAEYSLLQNHMLCLHLCMLSMHGIYQKK